MDGVEYFSDSEGVFRIKLAGKVSNLNKNLYFLTDSSLPAGNYRMVLHYLPLPTDYIIQETYNM